MSTDETPADRPLRRIAAACVVLMLVVVTASVFLRHYGGEQALQAVWASQIAWARLAHRVAATLVLLGSVAMVWMARHAPRHGGPTLWLASALLGVALLLSALGVAAGASRAAAVVLVNLLGGMAMLGLCARLALGPARRGGGRVAGWMLAFVVLQAASGALASASASPLCIGVADCGAWTLTHRFSGLLLACALLMFGLVTVWATRRRAAAALIGVALSLWLVGGWTAAVGSTGVPGLVVAHNMLAALAVVCTARLV
jgi:hypothetical protein